MYDEDQRLKIARYAIFNGSSAAARHFSAELGRPMNESTVRSIRNSYRRQIKKKIINNDREPLASLPKEPRGRRTLLPKEVDAAVQRHLHKIRAAGGVVNRQIVIATGRGIMAAQPSSVTLPDVQLDRTWAASLMERMNFVKRKGTKAGRKTPHNIEDLKIEYHNRIASVVREHNIPSK